MPWRKQALEREERVALVFMPVALFSVILFSCILNGWTDEQSKGIAVFIRLLMFAPIYLLLRSNEKALYAFGYGCAFSTLILVAQGTNEVMFQGADRAYGIYGSPGLFAGQACVFGLISFMFYRRAIGFQSRFIFLTGTLLAFIGLILSGSRATFFTVSLLVFFYAFGYALVARRILAVSATIASLGVLYFSVPIVTSQVDRGISEVVDYVETPNVLKSDAHGSVGTRFELWRVGLLIWKDHPLTGIGWRNFSSVTSDYVSAGLANPLVIGHRHPHNTYIEFLTNSGLLGLFILILWALMLRQRALNMNPRAGVESFSIRLYLGFLAIAAINEGGLFVYGNSLSFYLIATAALMSNLHHQYERNRLLPASSAH